MRTFNRRRRAPRKIEDLSLPDFLVALSRLVWISRIYSLVWLGVAYALGGKSWLLGAFLGGLAVEINLQFLTRTLIKAPTWQGTSLRPTLLRFYLLFGATLLLCFLVIHNAWGNPLAFLVGLLSFLTALMLAIVSMVLVPLVPKNNEASSPTEGENFNEK